jgi:hypothetical protein
MDNNQNLKLFFLLKKAKNYLLYINIKLFLMAKQPKNNLKAQIVL